MMGIRTRRLNSIASLIILTLTILLVTAHADAKENDDIINENTTTLTSGTLVNVPHVSTMLSVDQYRIWINMMPPVPPYDAQSLNMNALFTLINNSGSGIEFELISHCGETKHVQFILFNEMGEILWKYIQDDLRLACPDYLDTHVLPTGITYRYWIKVPLVINGEVLEPGEYLLKAYVDGSPSYGAFAPFRIDYAY